MFSYSCKKSISLYCKILLSIYENIYELTKVKLFLMIAPHMFIYLKVEFFRKTLPPKLVKFINEFICQNIFRISEF